MDAIAVGVGVVVALACWGLTAGITSVGLVPRGIAIRCGLPVGGFVGLFAATVAGVPVSTSLVLAVLLGFLLSIGVVTVLDGPAGAWGRRLRARFLYGVPWGTLVVVCGVSAFYLFVQGGWSHPNDPLTLPFTSWSLLYPLGVLTAPFAHVSASHVTGNLLGTVVYAPLAEYAWSHYPPGEASGDGSGAHRWRSNPAVRAFVLFPLGVVCVGLLTSVLAWGPIIGFSGVVFAFGAFALVRYPLALALAVAARSVVSATYYALVDPVVVASAHASYGGPWWANVAVQGHATGVFIGVLLGALLVARRGVRPSAFRLWGAAVVYATSVPLYILWWYRGPSTFVLYRGLGVLFVVLIGLFVAAGVHAVSRPFDGAGWLSRLDTDWLSHLGAGVDRRQVASLFLVFPLLVVAFVAVPVNLTTVADGPPANAAHAVHVRDYTVTYAEDVPNRRVGAINVSLLNESTNVNASGVLVSNPSRHLWTQAVSAGRLAYAGDAAVRVGGPGWSRVVRVHRRGWTPLGNRTVYRVAMTNATGKWNHVYSSPNETADPVIDGRRVTVANAPWGFELVVRRANETVGRTPIPSQNATAAAGGLEFDRNATRIWATSGRTNVTVADAETYH